MNKPKYERMATELSPAWDEVAFLYYDDCNPVREHFVCYCITGPNAPRRYVIASMDSEDTDFYDYCGAAPEARDLEPYAIYRVLGSDKVRGYDQEHIILCLSNRTIEFTGQVLRISEATDGSSALDVLLDHVRRVRGSSTT